MCVETFTGLRMGQFERLGERGGNGPGDRQPWRLPLAERVLLVVALPVQLDSDRPLRRTSATFSA